MNPAIKDEWVKALRSGDYEQGKDRLHDKFRDTFCCLGVLAAVVPEIGADQIRNDSKYNLTPCSLCIAGLSQSEQTMLISMNDAHADTFAQIADYIEASL